jgi:hypothetical protein
MDNVHIFFERLVREKIIRAVDPDSFQPFQIILLEHPKIVLGTEYKHPTINGSIIPIEVYDGEVRVGTFKIGVKTHRGNESRISAFELDRNFPKDQISYFTIAAGK